MIKKLKIGLLIAVLSLFLGINSVFAADLSWSADSWITVGSTDYKIVSGSEATSIVSDTSTITVVVPASSTFTLSSLEGYELDNDGSIDETCSSRTSSIAIVGSKTVIITPDTATAACRVSSGGGGGGGSSTPAVPAVVCSAGQTYNPTTGQKCNVVSTVPATPATPAIPGNSVTSNTPSYKTYNFGKAVLKNGSRGEAVKELQRFLNANLNLGLVVDGKLGPKTIKVIKQWQKDNGLKADGLVGPKTKEMMNSLAQ